MSREWQGWFRVKKSGIISRVPHHQCRSCKYSTSRDYLIIWVFSFIYPALLTDQPLYICVFPKAVCDHQRTLPNRRKDRSVVGSGLSSVHLLSSDTWADYSLELREHLIVLYRHIFLKIVHVCRILLYSFSFCVRTMSIFITQVWVLYILIFSILCPLSREPSSFYTVSYTSLVASEQALFYCKYTKAN